jgi:hypothetical protein
MPEADKSRLGLRRAAQQAGNFTVSSLNGCKTIIESHGGILLRSALRNFVAQARGHGEKQEEKK